MDGERLVNEAELAFRTYTVMPNEHAYTLSALYAAMCNVRTPQGDYMFYVAPRIYYGSNLPGSGKSTCAQIMASLVYNGKMIAASTVPAIVMHIDRNRAVLAIDELDQTIGVGRVPTDLVTVLNTGYKRGATVDKVRNNQIQSDNVHMPIILNGLASYFLSCQQLEPTRQRTHIIMLDKVTDWSAVTEYSDETCEPKLHRIRNGLVRWGMTHGRSIVSQPVDRIMPDIHGRDKEIWKPLFQVAAELGGQWPKRCEMACRAFVFNDSDDNVVYESPSDELLRWCVAIFRDGEEKLATNEVIERLMNLPGEFWWHTEWSRTESLRPAQMSLSDNLSRVHGVAHHKLWLTDGETVSKPWGYYKRDLLAALDALTEDHPPTSPESEDAVPNLDGITE